MLYYLSYGEFPSKKAHSIQMVRMCDAFSQNGIGTTLIHPSYGGGSVDFERIREYYGVTGEFNIQTIPSFSGKNSIPNVPTSGEMLTAAWLAGNLIANRITSDDLIFSRYTVPTSFQLAVSQFFPSSRQPTVVYEQHQVHEDHPLLNQRFYDRVDGVVCIADSLRSKLQSTYDIPDHKILVAHDGVDLRPYEYLSQGEARKELGIPRDEQIVAYTGHLYEDKNVDLLLRAAEDIEASVYIVGGHEEDIERLKRTTDIHESVTFTGFVEPSDISKYQVAADVLVATASSGAQYYSPLKLFEYMAAKKPIVATRTPSFSEVLTHEETCLFVDPGDADALSSEINRVVFNSDLREQLSREVAKLAEEYSWERRGERIVEFMERL